MGIRLCILAAYLLVTLVIGLIFRRRAAGSRLEFFLAGRGLSPVLLFFTLTATNFSAFTIFGLSGAGYRIGYAFYPIMGFGTGFMALSFHVIGAKILRLAASRNYLTPADFIADRYGSPALKRLFSLVMIVFTLPYIAIQAVASGRSLSSLIGLPYLAGAFLVTAFIVVYVMLGGMRSIAWTDLVQGGMMLVFTLAAFLLIARAGGGFLRVQGQAAAGFPALFSRPGLDGSMLPGVWLGYLVLWFFADPMFPQLFQRFMAAKDERTLRTSIVLYPLITGFLFFLTVSIGVMGRQAFPNLPAAESDNIFPLLLQAAAGPALSTLLLTGSIAALMSTMDSQLLTLTSMISGDFLPARSQGIRTERLIVALIGLAGFAIALRPPATLLAFISKTTFNGLSVLAPTVIGGLYWRRANRWGAAASILAGEALVVLFYFRLLAFPGVLPVLPILLATACVFIAVSLLTPAARENSGIVFPLLPGTGDRAPGAGPAAGPARTLARAGVFLLLFVLACDFWAWGRQPLLTSGLPLWVWYHILLTLLLSAAYKLVLGRPNPPG
jgi:SSS family solute:Na+ symporter